MPACDGCLGTTRCWVCLGSGLVDDRALGPQPCHRCYGSGQCWLCQQIALADIEEPPLLRLGPLTLRRRRRSTDRASPEDAA